MSYHRKPISTLTPRQLQEAAIAAELRRRGATWEHIAQLLHKRPEHVKRRVLYLDQHQEATHA